MRNCLSLRPAGSNDPFIAGGRRRCLQVREFLSAKNPGAAKQALAEIFSALQNVHVFPGLGKPTEDIDVRQIVVPFGNAGYIVRYTVRSRSGNVLVLRIWHGREART